MTPDNDGAARRAYWAEQMQAGYDLIQQVLPFEIAECHEPFASIVDAAATADVEMEFSGTKIAGDLERVFFIRAGLVDQVHHGHHVHHHRHVRFLSSNLL